MRSARHAKDTGVQAIWVYGNDITTMGWMISYVDVVVLLCAVLAFATSQKPRNPLLSYNIISSISRLRDSSTDPTAQIQCHD